MERCADLSSTSREICVVLPSTAMIQGGTGAFATPWGPSAIDWAVKAFGKMYSSSPSGSDLQQHQHLDFCI